MGNSYMDQSELLIRIDERVKALHDLLQTTITNQNKDTVEIWAELKLIKADIEALKLENTRESVPVKIRNSILWIVFVGFIGWLSSFLSEI
jgi:hypothetical protein